MRDRKREPYAQKKMVERWNKKHPIGTDVTVTKDLGEVLMTQTRSEAWMLGGHTAVIMVDGITGCYALERVNAM